jgi:hypothetical protein
VAAAPAIAAALGKARAADGLQRAPALDRRGVQEHQVVVKARAASGEHAGQPVDRLAQALAALVVGRLGGKAREQVVKAPSGDRQEAPVGGDPHDHLGHGQRDHLGVVELAPGVGRGLRQEIVGGDTNRGAEGVEVGVHRDLRVSGARVTADFGPSARGPFSTARSVESII